MHGSCESEGASRNMTADGYSMARSRPNSALADSTNIPTLAGSRTLAREGGPNRGSLRVNHLSKIRKFFSIALLGWMLSNLASAVPAVTMPELNSPGTFASQNSVQGWEFSTNLAIQVTHLGVFDGDQDGLVSAHDVGIFSSSGNLLASVNVPTGNAATLFGQFRSMPIAPLLLPAGQTFRIAAHYPVFGEQVLTAATETVNPAINYLGARSDLSPTLINPTTPQLSDRFGPNFEFVLAASGVPELNGQIATPLAITMLILGILTGRRQTRTQ